MGLPREGCGRHVQWGCGIFQAEQATQSRALPHASSAGQPAASMSANQLCADACLCGNFLWHSISELPITNPSRNQQQSAAAVGMLRLCTSPLRVSTEPRVAACCPCQPRPTALAWRDETGA